MKVAGYYKYLSGKVHEDLPYGLDLSGKFSGKLLLTESLIGKLTGIYIYISQHPHPTKEDIATYLERSEETSKKYLQKLTAINPITPEGGNKNITYSITWESRVIQLSEVIGNYVDNSRKCINFHNPKKNYSAAQSTTRTTDCYIFPKISEKKRKYLSQRKKMRNFAH